MRASQRMQRGLIAQFTFKEIMSRSRTLSTKPRSEQRALGMKQIAAGVTLIVKSNLMTFDLDECAFRVEPSALFEKKASALDRDFGRVMYWLWFSTGAEYLLKGFLILADPQFLESEDKFATPPQTDGGPQPASWPETVIAHTASKVPQDYFGTMGKSVHLAELLSAQRDFGEVPDESTARQAQAAYGFLGNAIRNRDAHAYVPNVRMEHAHMTNEFAPAFNTLLAAVGKQATRSELNKHSIARPCAPE